jgi:hypothetical protein
LKFLDTINLGGTSVHVLPAQLGAIGLKTFKLTAVQKHPRLPGAMSRNPLEFLAVQHDLYDESGLEDD